MRYVFVAHANSDKRRLRPVIELLLDRGIPLWIDRPEDIGLGERHLKCGRIVAGEDWQQQIDSALAQAHCVLFFLSSSSNQSNRSDSLYREYESGRRRGILVPVKIDVLSPDEINPFFRLVQFIDLPINRPHLFKSARRREKLEILVDQLHGHLSSTDNLARSNPAAVGELAPPPRLLPYLADRRQQQNAFERSLDTFFQERSKKPIVLFVVGREDQCADSFVEQMYYVSLRKRLIANTGSSNSLNCCLRWPTLESDPAEADTDSAAEHFVGLEAEVRASLAISHSELPKSICRTLVKRNSALFFWSTIHMSDWCAAHLSLAAKWVDWWQAVGVGRVGQPIILLLCIQYDRSLLSRVLHAMRRSRVQSLLDGFARSRTNAYVTRLPELSDIGFDDIAHWIREYVHGYDREVLRREIRRRFQNYLWVGRRLPMEQSAKLIRIALENPEARPIEQL